MNYYFNDLLPLQKDIWEKINKISILDDEISSKRKVIEESQPIVFSILQNLVNAGLNEHDILNVFKIFRTDLCNNMPYGNSTYLERLSKDLDKYRTVRDTLQSLNTKILIKKSHIDKLAVLKSNLEAFLLSLGITTIYFYSIILLNALQVQQIQKNLIKTILLVCVFNYLLPLLLFIVIKGVKKSEVKIQNRTEQQQQQKKEKKGKKVVKEKKLQRKKINTFK
jgi:hypothetical protein